MFSGAWLKVRVKPVIILSFDSKRPESLETLCSVLELGSEQKTQTMTGLRVFYPRPLLQPSPDLIESFGQIVDFSASEGLFPLDEAARAALCTCIEQPEQLALLKALQNSQKPCVLAWLKADGPITSTPRGLSEASFAIPRLNATQQSESRRHLCCTAQYRLDLRGARWQSQRCPMRCYWPASRDAI